MSTLISQKLKLVFVHIPKNGGSSITHAIKKLDPDALHSEDLVYYSDHLWKKADLKPHFTGNMIDEYDYAATYDRFCVVRNPWERMVSLYNHRFRKPKSYTKQNDIKMLKSGFNKWLQHTNHISDKVLTRTAQSEWTTGCDILRFENLNEDFAKLGYGELEHRNATTEDSSKYHLEYNKTSKKHIEKYFSEDIEVFRYKY